ncbi:glycosyltransferase family 4 protein [Nocardiopsis alba]
MTERKTAPRKPRARKTGATLAAKPKPRTGFGKTEKPLKVLARVHAYPPLHNAGAEWMLHTMLRALVERGHDVTVWLSRYSELREPYELDGVTVVPFASQLDIGAAIRRADIAISHLENVPSLGALARGFTAKFVAVCHNTFPRSFQDASGAALAVYNSEWMRGEAEEFYSAKSNPPRDTLVIRPPVVADDYRTTPGEAITLINVNADKGGDLLWRLAARMPDRQFLGVRGAYGDQVEPPEPLPNLTYIDHVPGHEMAERVYSLTKALLLPSRYESWGRVGVEAMASGIPVVGHPTPGICEMLGDAAILADRDDLDAWLAVLDKLLKPAEYQRASKAALARSAELDPHDDLIAWCEAIENL